MKRKGLAAETVGEDKLEAIKKLAIVAMFSDDELLDQLVLKGGNAMDLVHRISTRASVDLDFSLQDDFDQVDAEKRVEQALLRTFDLNGFVAFDIKMSARPGELKDELAAFWGGYLVEFKLISTERANGVGRDLEVMRREAIRLGEASRFTIDISRYEYTQDKQETKLDGYTIYVYSPEMIVCEKLRAICQQIPAYREIIGHGRPKQRARDFVDIELLVKKFNVNVGSASSQHIIQEMFALKRVPLVFLSRLAEVKDFHGNGFDAVKATVKAGATLQPWDYYFDFVQGEVGKLAALF